jgi:hypothetical protein
VPWTISGYIAGNLANPKKEFLSEHNAKANAIPVARKDTYQFPPFFSSAGSARTHSTA